MGIVDLAYNPALYTHNVRWGGDFGGSTVLKPGIRKSEQVRGWSNNTNRLRLPSSRHCGTCHFVAESHAAVRVDFLDDLDHASQ